MKTLTILMALFAVVTLRAQKGEAKRYALKSGYVSYTLTGSTVGTKTLYWDNYGDKTWEEIKSTTEVKMFGIKNKEETHSINITVGNKFWNINMLDKTGQTGTIETYDMSKEIAEGITEAEAKKLEEDILNALNGEKLGTEDFLGKECEVVKVMGSKCWFYKGIILKTMVKMMGIESNETATELKENIDIKSSKFSPITNIDYQDMDALKQSIF